MSERYAVRKRLGGGSTGVVYEAFDKEREAIVALKTLRTSSTSALYRLKQEFRALADIAHRNLVSLYELVGSDDGWYIVMERVQGVSFLEHVRGATGPHLRTPGTWASSELSFGDGDDGRVVVNPDGPPSLPTDLERLRSALVQLLTGIAALHDRGLLHRDIKPSNVLVTPKGRVVLLDFGLAWDTDRSASEQSRIDRVVGTAAFMSPEQGAGDEPTEASDLYSVGVMLFQALTGKLPFAGTLVEILLEKQSADPPAPSDLVDGVPTVLDRLCVDLLSRNPSRRPTARHALVRLGADTSRIAAAPLRSTRLEGREVQRHALEQAWATAAGGRAVTVVVRGGSGIGKTSLVRHFLAELRKREPVSVLSGRCYEREAVPFKAFDSVIDAVRRRLSKLTESERGEVLPRGIGALARLFPVLGPLIPGETTVESPGRDAFDVRKRALGGLCDLLSWLASSKPLVLFLDDVQWGDTDSALLLVDVLVALAEVPVLTILAYRTEDAASSEFVTAFDHAPRVGALDVRDLELRELDQLEATAVARGLLPEDHPDASESAVWIARESGGNPFLMSELAAHLVAAGPEAGAALERQTLDDLFRARVAGLSRPAQDVMQAVAAAGRPLPIHVIAKAAGVTDALEPVAQLRAGRLVRTSRTALGDSIEAYHSRVGTAIAGTLTDDERAAVHLSLARALEGTRLADPETLMRLYLQASLRERAATLALAAGRAAVEALAFARAASLLEQALELGDWERDDQRAILAELGDALALGGRGVEAARAWIAAAELADGVIAQELQRRAAEQLVCHGHLADGEALLARVLAAAGVRDPGQGGRFALLAGRVWRWWFWRRHGDAELDVLIKAEVDERVGYHADILGFAAMVYALVQPRQGALFHQAALRRTLVAADPRRLVRDLGLEATLWSTSGRDPELTAGLVRRLHRLSARSPHPESKPLVHLTEGVVAFVEGRFRESHRALVRAERGLSPLPGSTFHLATARCFDTRALVNLGELAEARAQRDQQLAAAEARGNLLVAAALKADVTVLLRLAEGDTAQALLDIDSVLSAWSGWSWHFPRYFATRARAFLYLYEGRATEAWDLVDGNLGPAAKAGFLHNTSSRVALGELAVRCAVGATLRLPDTAVQRRARHLVAELGRERGPHVQGYLAASRAALATLDGRTDAAREHLTAARDRFEAAEMRLHTLAMAWRLGELGDGDAATHAAVELDKLGVVEPERLVDALAAPVVRPSALSRPLSLGRVAQRATATRPPRRTGTP